MRVFLVAVVSGWMFFSACSSSGSAQLSESAANARIDSMVGEQTKDLIQQAEEDLDRRMAIEVKAKADSLVAARRATGTATPAPAAPAPATQP